MKRLLKAFLPVFILTCAAVPSEAASSAKAVYSDGTITFYYDEADHSSEGDVYLFAMKSGKPTWPESPAYKGATRVVFDSSVADWKVGDCQQWFYQFTKVREFEGFEYLDITRCTSLRRFFKGCAALVEVDISGFDTSNIANFSEMFDGCKSLTTVYVGPKFTTAKGTSFGTMFENCTKLVGGNGTAFAAGNDYKTYACADFPGQPGYFTGKGIEPPKPHVELGAAEVAVAANGRSATVSVKVTACNVEGTLKLLVDGKEVENWPLAVGTFAAEASVKRFVAASYEFVAQGTLNGEATETRLSGVFVPTVCETWFDVAFADDGYVPGAAWFSASEDASGGAWSVAPDGASLLVEETRTVKLKGEGEEVTYRPSAPARAGADVVLEGRLAAYAVKEDAPVGSDVKVKFGFLGTPSFVRPALWAAGAWHPFGESLATGTWVDYALEFDYESAAAPRVRAKAGAVVGEWVALRSKDTGISSVSFHGGESFGSFRARFLQSKPRFGFSILLQ